MGLACSVLVADIPASSLLPGPWPVKHECAFKRASLEGKGHPWLCSAVQLLSGGGGVMKDWALWFVASPVPEPPHGPRHGEDSLTPARTLHTCGHRAKGLESQSLAP